MVHVVDVSHPQASKQAEAVFRILEELQVSDELPMVTAWNKLDAHANPDIVRSVASTRPDTVAVSGSSGVSLVTYVLRTCFKSIRQACAFACAKEQNIFSIYVWSSKYIDSLLLLPLGERPFR